MSIKLPFWLSSQSIAQKIANVAQQFYDAVIVFLRASLIETNALTCPEQILELLAFERGVTHIQGESIALFRKRVHYAFLNTRDSGSVAGFYAIFERLGLNLKDQKERLSGQDWDIISIDINLSGNDQALIEEIIAVYGRACRRYALNVGASDTISLRLFTPAVDIQRINIGA